MTLTLSEVERLAYQSFQTGRWIRAEKLFCQLLESQPAIPAHWFMLGACRHRLSRLELALEAFERLLRLDPYHRQGLFAATAVANELGLFSRALSHCHALLEQDPSDPQALTSTGIVLEALGRKTEALQYYERALAHDAGWRDALINRGALLLELGDSSAALLNNRQLLACYPAFSGAHLEVGKASMACGQYEAADAAFVQALSMQPDDGATFLHAGFSKALQEDFAAAQAFLDRARQVAPALVSQYAQSIFPTQWDGQSSLDARSLYLLHHFECLGRGDWAARDRFVAVFGDLIGSGAPPLRDRALGFRALALGLSPALQKKLAIQIAEDFVPSLRHQFHRPTSTSERPLRLGYVSPSFRSHAVGFAIQRVFKLHDRKHFCVYAYAIGPDANDDVHDEIKKGVDVWRDLGGLDDVAAARLIADDEIDVLVDLAGYVDHCRPGIFALRPAPVQVGAVDYPATRGAPWIDYLLLDPITASSEVEENCSEKILRMPHHMLPCSYADFQTVQPSRIALGLPEGALILAAFHSPYKIDPDVFALWMRLLRLRDDAYLWLLSGSEVMEANLKRQARQHGVDPGRLIFAPRLGHFDHLSRFAAADLFLDTLVCNGGMTVCDALVAGVPVLTCMGRGVAQRMAAGILLAAGFPEGVTNSLTEYEERALVWLSNPEVLRDMREQLLDAKATAPFYRLEQWVQYFEKAVEIAHQRRVQGLAAAPITIDEDVSG